MTARHLKAAFTIMAACTLVVAAGYFRHFSGRSETNPQVAPTHQGGISQSEQSPIPRESTSGNIASSPSHFCFVSMTSHSGIDFRYYGSPSRETYMTDQNGGGIGLIDFDEDGLLDLFFVNGSHFAQPAAGDSQSNKIYRALGDFRYEEVTLPANLTAHGFGMGCAVGDFDNDGFSDLFVAGYEQSRLWRNQGDGTFREETESAGVGSDRWGTSAAFADLDGDGFLDLYVVNYVEWSPEEPPCHPLGHKEIVALCSPTERDGQPSSLFRNTGTGSFDPCSERSGIARAPDGKGLALAIADFNGDGRLDVYVANDTTPNFLFRNQGNMTFEEVAVAEGVAISNDGNVGAGMGVACADYDRNGFLDLAVTNFRNQVNDVFANLGSQGFVATNSALGFDFISRSALGFGIVFADFDLDTWPDLFVANGHIWDLTSLGPEHEYAMYPQLVRNLSGQRFVDESPQSGDYFRERWLGRAAAIGDLDNDGDTDLVVSHLAAQPAILRNDSDRKGDSIRVRLIGTQSSRQPLGCQLNVRNGERSVAFHVPSGGSFQAAHDIHILIPTQAEHRINEIRVTWSNGESESWSNQSPDSRGNLTLIEGTGDRRRKD